MIEIKLSDKCWNLWASIYWWWMGFAILLCILLWGLTKYYHEDLPLLLLLIPTGLMAFTIYYNWYMRKYWKKFHFQYDEKELKVFSGVWWQKQILVPFSRITNIDIIQGPWQRSRDLATLNIQTAGRGGTQIAEAQLWSQDNYKQLRDDLLSRISKKLPYPSDGTGESLVEENEQPNLNKMIYLLEKIEKNTQK